MANRRTRKVPISDGTIQLQLPLLSDALKENQLLRGEMDQLRQENDSLRQENASLKAQLGRQPEARVGLMIRETQPSQNAQDCKQVDKLKLLRSLFYGRQDVYSERGKNKNDKGKWTYWPARQHDWSIPHKSVKGAKSQCSLICPVLPISDRVLEDHLNGKRTIGIYPLLQDETCRLLAHDFDKGDWMSDVIAFLKTCDDLEVSAHLERSQSGNGAHVWIFFDAPVAASQARALGSYLVTKTNERFFLNLDSYDRMFPSQDTMPEGNFGNLIALPLQLEPSKLGNSVFVDRNFQPFDDQWKYLSSIVPMRAADVRALVQAIPQESLNFLPEPSDDETSSEPWKRKPSGPSQNPNLQGAIPNKASVVLSNMIYLNKAGFSNAALNRIMSIAAFQNPKFYKHQAMRLSTYNIPRVISCAENLSEHIALPRGCLIDLTALLKANKIDIELTDERITGTPIDASFTGTLRPEQATAAEAIISSDIGILSGTTGFGKTVVSAFVIGQRKVNTLVIVETKTLLAQWKERLPQFLSLPGGTVGQIGGGKKKPTHVVDIATIQTLNQKGTIADLVAEYGQIILDECHHISAFTYEAVVKQAKAKYVLGLTATPVRKEGDHPIFMMQCGPIVFKDTRRLQERHPGVSHIVIPRETGFQAPAVDGQQNFQDLCAALSADSKRNDLICDDILKVLEEKRSPLAITERIDHLETLIGRLQGFAKNIFVLKGGMSDKEMNELRAKLKDIPDNEERIILAIGKCAGEGFDDSRLDTLFLTLPISWHGKVEQYVGRMHRQHEGKTEVRIYDYMDSGHPQLKGMYKRRATKYRKIGYEIRP